LPTPHYSQIYLNQTNQEARSKVRPNQISWFHSHRSRVALRYPRGFAVHLGNPLSSIPAFLILQLGRRIGILVSRLEFYYGAGVTATLTVGIGTGVTDGALFGATGATVATGGAETAGTLFMIGAAVGTGTLGKVSLSGRLPVRTPGVGLVVGAVVVPVWPVVLVCAETSDSAIMHDATITK
jgi:hypothetical protein